MESKQISLRKHNDEYDYDWDAKWIVYILIGATLLSMLMYYALLLVICRT